MTKNEFEKIEKILLDLHLKYYHEHEEIRHEIENELEEFYKKHIGPGSKLWKLNLDFHNEIHNTINDFKKDIEE